MKAAPLKGDCLICQAPGPTRTAINDAIWPAGTVRAADYRAAGVAAAKASKVPELANLDPKTITRHADHVEAVWRVIEPGQPLRDDEVPLDTSFGGLMEGGSRLGAKAAGILEQTMDNMGVAMFAIYPKETIAIAKLGLGAAVSRETSRLKKNQQVIDVMAIFAAGSGHLPDDRIGGAEREVELETMREELATERKLLAARAQG